MERTASLDAIASKGFTGVGGGLGLIDSEQGTIWMDITLILSAGVALLAVIWAIERSALLGVGLVASE